MKKYYFVSYVWKMPGEDYRYSNALTDVHPFAWLVNTRRHQERFELISYKEITEEEYNEYEDQLN